MMNADQPVLSPSAREFIQTAKSDLPALDRWSQISEEEVAVVADMTRRNEISGGTPTVREFEKTWREWIGTRFALTVVNGSSALYSAYFGLGVGPGDEVICPVNTWICSIAPAIMLGAKPVFCDIDPESLMMDPEDLQSKITDKTRCICAVHLWGNVCDLDALMGISRSSGIPLLEDCSHAHGARYKGKMCGSIGRVGCWSLQGSKPVSGGEAGVVATDDIDLFERACLVGQVNRIAGIDLVAPKYQDLQPLGLGMKFRAHPLAVGIASVQLKRLPELNRRRSQYVAEVEAGLTDIRGLRPVKVYPGSERAGFYGFPIKWDPPKGSDPQQGMDRVASRAQEKGVKVGRTSYPNLHDLPLFQRGFDLFTRDRGPLCASSGYKGYKAGDFPQAERAARTTLFLPVLSDPVPGASEKVLEALRYAVGS